MADFPGAALFGTPGWPGSLAAATADTYLGALALVLSGGTATPGTLELAGIAQASTRALDAGFTYEVAHSDPAAPGDALNPALYTLSGAAGLPRVQSVQHVGPGVVRLLLDAAIPVGILLEFEVAASIEAEDPARVTGPILTASLILPTYGAARTGARLDVAPARRDLRNPQSATGEPGTLALDGRGDYANEAGREYFRKRVIRRATTARGGFALLPSYGFKPRIKGLIRSSDLEQLRREIERQVLEEPDATTVRATVSIVGPGLVLARISATHSSGFVVTGETTIEIGA